MRIPRQQQVQEVLEKFYETLPADVAAEVRRKNDLDAARFSEAAKECTPSQDLAFWAKRNCKDCWGRGHCGYALNKGFVKCRCTEVNYHRWLVDFRRYYNELRKIARAEGYDV